VLDPDGRLRPRDVVPVEIDGDRTEVPALAGTPAADLLLVNDGDLTYAKIRIDPTGLAGVLPAVADPLTRALIWGSVWDATRDAEVPPAVFLDLIAAGLPAESNVAILPKVQTQALENVVDRFLPDDQRAAGRVRVAVAARAAFDAAPAGSGWQLAAVRGLIRSAGPDDAAELRGWLAGQWPNDLVVDAELRWLILIRLAELGAVGLAEVEDEYARDRTAVAAEKAARCRSALPDPVAKAAAWQRLIDDDSMSNKLLFATALGFWVAGQEAITGSYVERYVRDVPAMGRRRAAIVGERIAQFAYPATAVTPATHAALTAMEQAELTPGVRRALSDGNDEMARALAARARAAS
jgi:aminopeptidase N